MASEPASEPPCLTPELSLNDEAGLFLCWLFILTCLLPHLFQTSCPSPPFPSWRSISQDAQGLWEGEPGPLSSQAVLLLGGPRGDDGGGGAEVGGAGWSGPGHAGLKENWPEQ